MTTKELIAETSFVTTRKFYDDKNYPRGMGRSGDYSISEVTILEKYGVALQEIASGKREPKTAEEEHFKAVCTEGVAATTAIEKAWLKYQNKVLSPKQFHTLFGSSKPSIDGADDLDTVDLDLEDD